MIANCHSSSVHYVGKVCLDAHCFRLFSVYYTIDKVAIKLGCRSVSFFDKFLLSTRLLIHSNKKIDVRSPKRINVRHCMLRYVMRSCDTAVGVENVKFNTTYNWQYRTCILT